MNKKNQPKNNQAEIKEENFVAQEIQELEEALKRTAADFANYRKRMEEQKQESVEYAKADFMAKITPVLDNFRRAFEHIPEEQKNADWIIGIKQIEKQLEDILRAEGLEKIDTTEGKFDPSFHEAISCEENENCPADHIIAEVESGWKYKNKVLKPAKVRVSKGK